MESILDAINEWIKEILIGAINGNLSTMFRDVNEKVGMEQMVSFLLERRNRYMLYHRMQIHA